MTYKLICKHCEWQWDYKGKKKLNVKYSQYTSCPRCRSLVKIKEDPLKEHINKHT
jgi:hypothetical protein